MIKNYFLVAWRNITKHRFFAMVNVCGLAIGITFVLLIGVFAWGEWQVNRFIKSSDRIFLLKSKWANPETGVEFATLGPLTKALQDNYPTLIEKAYAHDAITVVVTVGDKPYREGVHPGDSTLFDVFNFPVLYGDPRTALDKPNAVVLTEKKANQFFGKSDVVGKLLKIQSFDGRNDNFEITAVIKDLPFNTVTNYAKPGNEIFLAPASVRYFGRTFGFNSWQSPNIVGYVLLKPGVKPEQLKGPLATLIKTNATPEIQKALEVHPVALKDCYLSMYKGLAGRMVAIFSLVALFILLMAIINFVNISVGNSLTRLKEIGVRKAMGSRKRQLILQFITESVLVVTFSFIVSVALFFVLQPMFVQLIGKPLPSLASFPVWFASLPVMIILVTGLLAGLYPAFVLSAQPSVAALKGKLKNVQEKLVFRRSLVIVQFVTAIVVFIVAIVIDKQVSFFFHTDLGYDKDHIVTVPVPRDWTATGVKHMERMRDEFRAMTEIKDASFSYEITDGWSSGAYMVYRAENDSSTAVSMTSVISDERFPTTYNIKMKEGAFYNGAAADSSKLVITEAAARSLGWKDPAEAMNKPVRIHNINTVMYVSGVVKDFHFGTMKEAIAPVCFIDVRFNNIYRYLSFRLGSGNPSRQIAALERKWREVFPDAPFDFKFLDDSIAQLYETETQMQKAARVATVVSLMIVLLGVLGIVTLSIARRSKEMGIRKVLGATSANIISLFVKEFSWIMVISNVVAWPLAWYLCHRWLMDYAYRVDIGVEPFLMVGMLLLVLVFVVITGMTRRLAATNPVKSLSTE
ncbi:FtsX-like permease family protein [Chitinophaga polysaccharea]|uniref:ABC transporter permease n=1 Tax=Chitinophaga polysaccharea TaxID=1293035 RepID=UPI001455BD57|nr:ABC transporter permease [Chitinophaga polysaccharea]NLR59844.1 FtsX-like permease family protein [Chitinophaga polysaccharea]